MTDNPAGATSATGGQGDPGQHDQPLNAGGMRALESERQARREAEQRAKVAESRITELETASLRREVAADKGLSVKQAERLRGSTRQELEADADDLRATFLPDDSGRERDGGKSSQRWRPKEQLRPGTPPTHEDDDDDFGDPAKIADRVIGGDVF